MRIAVITPTFQTHLPWLKQCLASVRGQTISCTHILVSDGDDSLHAAMFPDVQFSRMHQPHRDCGNAARAIGSVSAIAQDFDAITYLDADNWFEVDHLQKIVELHQRTGAAVCTNARNLYDQEGRLLGYCPEVDGESFVDTNCLFLTRPAFDIIAVWYSAPHSLTPVGDRVVWQAIKAKKLTRAHLRTPTVNYRTCYRAHYEYFGKSPPANAKHVVIQATPDGRILSSGNQVQEAAAVPAPRSVPEAIRPRVSLCMIVKNEEQNLAACLSPVADLFDEIIVVDTGSTDRTKEIAVQQGASVFEFPWTDDFAAARNEALRHATGMWIFWLDADDRLDADNLAKLRQLMRDLPDANHAYMMRQLSVPDELTDSALAVDHARLFRRHPQVQWRYRVHEQILACLRESGAKLVWTDIVIRHLGYQDPSQRQRKHDRNLRILRMELEEKPDDSFILFNLAATYMEHGQVTTAMPYLSRCLEKAHAGVSFLPKVYVLLTRGSQRLGRNDEALRYCREGKQRFPEEAELWFEEGSFLLAHGELAMARLCFERILGLHSRRNYVGVDASLCSSHTRHNLALIYRGLKMPRQAEEQWRIVTQQTPEFGSAWMGLVETYLDQHRQSDLDALLLSLQGSSFGLTILPALQARVALAKGDYAGARKTLESAIAVSPKALWLRFVLTEILLLVGKDEEAAMQQLKAILALDPQHAQARQKLEQLEFRG